MVRTPDAIAVISNDVSLTYAELNGRANAVAERLIAMGAGPDVLVALCMERSVGMLVGLLGILKAGAAYLPIDLRYPAERVAFILEDAGVPLLISQRSLEDSLPKHQAQVLFLDDVTESKKENIWQPGHARQSGLRDLHLRFHGQAQRCGGASSRRYQRAP